MLSASLNPGGTLTGSNELFRTFDLDELRELVHRAATGAGSRNSLVVCTVTAIGTVLMGAAAAYAFSRFRFRGRHGA